MCIYVHMYILYICLDSARRAHVERVVRSRIEGLFILLPARTVGFAVSPFCVSICAFVLVKQVNRVRELKGSLCSCP